MKISGENFRTDEVGPKMKAQEFCVILTIFEFLGNCDFERDTCTWTNVLAGDTFDWLRHKGPTSSGRTGPSIDHTRQDASG